ncbi:MAG: response regulator transcription factor [Clostridia bacterium]|nr:response regulator transcription factor [Clostridia bacterium]MBP3627000.1 response regulator transcription factor [Clostridia bacterium]
MIWCVDDDNTIRDIEVYTLTQTGFEAKGFADGISMLEALKTEKPELIVLDIMLPGKDGVEVLKEIRSNPETRKIPVIMATAKGTEMDKIQGLDTGADDYLVKPFGVMEMVSRIKAVLRRCEPDEKEEVLTVGEITLSDKEHLVTVNGEKVALTFKEFEILKLFMSNPSIVFSRDKLLSEVWGIDYLGESRTVDMHIKTLRQKLGDAGSIIETVIGVGYKMEGKR